jgi:hypothetical protein
VKWEQESVYLSLDGRNFGVRKNPKARWSRGAVKVVRLLE